MCVKHQKSLVKQIASLTVCYTNSNTARAIWVVWIIVGLECSGLNPMRGMFLRRWLFCSMVQQSFAGVVTGDFLDSPEEFETRPAPIVVAVAVEC